MCLGGATGAATGEGRVLRRVRRGGLHGGRGVAHDAAAHGDPWGRHLYRQLQETLRQGGRQVSTHVLIADAVRPTTTSLYPRGGPNGSDWSHITWRPWYDCWRIPTSHAPVSRVVDIWVVIERALREKNYTLTLLVWLKLYRLFSLVTL